MRLKHENDLLNEGFRANVIDDIEGSENVERKNEAKKRYDSFKDNNKKYVLEAFKEESEADIVAEIKNRVSNVSFSRKIIDKKAIVYQNGVKREYPGNEQDSKNLEQVYDLVDFDSKMKKTNKYSELFKNSLVQVYPYEDKIIGKWKYMLKVLAPYLYDVIEDADNPEQARVVIFSYYSSSTSASSYKEPGQSGVRESNTIGGNESDGVNQIIADSPNDQGKPKKRYVWWSNNYHFTTDEKGLIIPGMQEEDLLNPFGVLPFVDFSMDKDGFYWAEGGQDIIDASILLNILLTDLYYIMKYQGMGIFYLIGNGVPKNLRVGPSTGITMEKKEGDPDTQIGFASSNPPIEAHISAIKEYVLYVLSTNNLSVDAINTGASGGGAESAIHEMVKNSENMNDVEDQKEMYRDNEPVVYSIIAKVHNHLLEKKLLADKFKEIGKLTEDEYTISFNPYQPFMTETEKLANIRERLDLFLDSRIDAIMRDNPDLEREEAKDKFRMVLEDKLEEQSKRFKREIVKEETNGESDIQDNIE